MKILLRGLAALFLLPLFECEKRAIATVNYMKSYRDSADCTDGSIPKSIGQGTYSSRGGVLQTPVKLTTSGRSKLTTIFTGEDFGFMHDLIC